MLGVWSVHGEGRAHFAHAPVMERVLSEHLSPLRFADDSGNLTMTYPMNPSGSPHGIAALCSPDGRHMAMMVRHVRFVADICALAPRQD